MGPGRGVAAAVSVLLTLAATAAVVSGGPAGPPEWVRIDGISNLFEGVAFDHETHMDMVDDCTACHHHTVGLDASDPDCAVCHVDEEPSESVACGSCHLEQPFTAGAVADQQERRRVYHLDRPGLMAAYHLSCRGCHEGEGGPTGCEDCHAKTEAGERFYRAGRYAPQGSAASQAH